MPIFWRPLLLSTLVTASLLLPVAIGGAGAATATPAETFTCRDCPITINDHVSGLADQTATPYPSDIDVQYPGFGPSIDTVTVSLAGLTHGSLDNVDVLLVAWLEGQAVELMSDVGGPSLVTDLNLTFDDSAPSSLPQNSPPASGVYKPTNYAGTGLPCVADNPPALPNSDPFPAPAPAPPVGGYSQTLSSFRGTPFHGFRLYVGDDCAGGAGVITSWSFDVTFIPTATTVVRFSSVLRQSGIELRWRTGTDVGLLGFNLFRTGDAKTARLNDRMIPARSSGASSGAGYRFLDRTARHARTYLYRLQIVDQSGARRWAGASATGLRPG